ncbi:hypothetical protein [Burkholderia stagnalis]|uniref:hypothetical protein n=1 Tax=Burkholderia stagnalis TaxID=1503054 RepID=UPI000319EF25|nr:hypothetical protein [Burkholderia stagnalis]
MPRILVARGFITIIDAWRAGTLMPLKIGGVHARDKPPRPAHSHAASARRHPPAPRPNRDETAIIDSFTVGRRTRAGRQRLTETT